MLSYNESHIDTILFDLGNTLVSYYTREEFPSILNEAMSRIAVYLQDNSLLNVSVESALAAAPRENYEAKDLVVRPLIGRICRIFELDQTVVSPDLELELSRLFLKPIFNIARIYDDVLPVLNQLRQAGYRSVIVSNTPWGSLASIWREELDRWGLGDLVDDAVFCEEVGIRKPAKEIFKYALNKLGTSPDNCVFVGDDPRWDIVGPQGVGMKAILIDRGANDSGIPSIQNLYELLDYLDTLKQE